MGDSQGLQFGYLSKNGYSLDFMFEQINPEFDLNTGSILRDSSNLGIGISKYLAGNSLKIQASAFKTNYKNRIIGLQDDELISASFLVQIAF